ncbi:unnamed protein product, partial [Allacma fusca]
KTEEVVSARAFSLI